MAHTVIPPPRDTTATLELTHKGNINDKTIPERDREVRDLKHDQDRQQICVLSQAFRSLFQVAVIFLLSVFGNHKRWRKTTHCACSGRGLGKCIQARQQEGASEHGGTLAV